MNRLAAAALLLLIAVSDGSALTRRDISNMSCEQIKELLRNEGRAILVVPSKRVAGLNRYGLYVDGQRSCRAPEVAGRRRVGSTTGTCFVYQCVDAGRQPNR